MLSVCRFYLLLLIRYVHLFLEAPRAKNMYQAHFPRPLHPTIVWGVICILVTGYFKRESIVLFHVVHAAFSQVLWSLIATQWSNQLFDWSDSVHPWYLYQTFQGQSTPVWHWWKWHTISRNKNVHYIQKLSHTKYISIAFLKITKTFSVECCLLSNFSP